MKNIAQDVLLIQETIGNVGFKKSKRSIVFVLGDTVYDKHVRNLFLSHPADQY
jgi:hypothetical protein